MGMSLNFTMKDVKCREPSTNSYGGFEIEIDVINMIKLESTSLFYQSCALLINSSHYNSDHVTYMKNWKKLDPWRNDFIKNKEKCLIQRQVFVYLSLRNVRKYLQSILLNSKTFFEVWIFYFKRWYLSWKQTKNWAPY